MRVRPGVFAALIALALPALCPPTTARGMEEDPYDEARRLEAAGKVVEAFRAYLALPGAAHHAARIGRTGGADLLDESAALLADAADADTRRRILLVRGDLLLRRGDRAAALDSYRAVAATLPRYLDDEWAVDQVPPHTYPVEATEDRIAAGRRTLSPFAIGPGSHRDNWLLRRFLALEAWPEAEAEFERLWAFHDATAGDGAYSGPALQFAIDYAYFLRARDATEQAFALLLKAVRRIDMDHLSPSVASPERQRSLRTLRRLPGMQPYGGIGRKEYVRLVHGTFREAGREAELVTALESDLAQGRNAARRVLARVHMQAGRVDEAVRLEFAYIAAGGFDPASAAIRRGRIYESVKRLPDAVTAYEEALAVPFDSVDLPDPDEGADRGAMSRESSGFSGRPHAEQVRDEVLHRLERLHAALGRPKEALACALRILQTDSRTQHELPALETGLRRFRAGGMETEYRAWLQSLAASSDIPVVRANAAWILGDTKAAARHVVESRVYLGEAGLDSWLDRVQERDVAVYGDLLDALARVDPSNGLARLRRLHFKGRLGSDEAAILFEDLLDGRATCEPSRSAAPWEPARLAGWGDVAYRLMRIYASRRDEDSVARLALRIARAEAPFTADLARDATYRSGNDVPEQLPASLAIAVQTLTSEQTLDELHEALAGSLWRSVRAQIERRRSPGWPRGKGAADFGWAHLPDGVQLLACNEDVLALAAADTHIYAGHPWGLAVYDVGGRPVTRVALGCAALSLAVGPDALWVATPLGIHRIDRDDFVAARLPGDQDLDPRRGSEDRERNQFRDHAARAVAWHAGHVWIATSRDVRTFDPRTGALRIYTADELRLEARGDWNRFVVDGDDLWVEGYHGARCYAPEQDGWIAPVHGDEQAEVRVLGRAAGALWGEVELGRRFGRRPCRIVRRPDAPGLAVDVLPIDASVRERDELERGEWSLHGTWEGRPVFGTRRPLVFLDPDTRTLRPLPADADGRVLAIPIDGAVADGLLTSRIRPGAGDVVRGTAETGDGQVRHGAFVTREWSLLRLGNGTLVLGGRANDARHTIAGEDRDARTSVNPHESSREGGGLWLFPPDGEGRRISTTSGSDALPDGCVFAATSEPSGGGGPRVWLATRSGLVVLNSEFRVSATLGRGEGLVADRFNAAATLDGRLYFGSEWGDCGGGLTVFDPATRVFTSLHPADGLATDRVAGLAAEGGRLSVRYGVQYRRWADHGHQRHPAGTYDPTTGTFTSGGDARLIAKRDVDREPPRPEETTPWLGGYVLSSLEIDGARVLCSTHGVVISRERVLPSPGIAALAATVVPDQPFLQQQDATRRVNKVRTLEELQAYVEDPNPFVRARALRLTTYSELRHDVGVGLVGPLLEERRDLVRRAAVGLLAALRTPDARPLLEAAQSDPDVDVRDSAALGLARLGVVPDLRIVERGFVRTGSSRSNLELCEGLAAVPTPEVVSLFLRFPLPTDDYAPRVAIMERMGRAVVEHPASVELLLRAQKMAGTSSDAPGFAQRVLGGGGAALLDRLHAALEDPDRVVRSNAARALGRIADRSSIPRLIAALQPESGLSRASAVWALGELRAREALPDLVRLYTDARIDQQRRAGAGFRIGQSTAAIDAAYELNSSPEGTSVDLDDLRPPRERPIHPLGEPLLTPQGVLEAVRAIGADAAQEFYRRLAGESDDDTRVEAARQLATGGASERDANIAVLKGLRIADNLRVRIAAAVSLSVLEVGPEYDAAVLSWLEGHEERATHTVLHELGRVTGTERLAPFRAALQAITDNPESPAAWRRTAQRILDRR